MTEKHLNHLVMYLASGKGVQNLGLPVRKRHRIGYINRRISIIHKDRCLCAYSSRSELAMKCMNANHIISTVSTEVPAACRRVSKSVWLVTVSRYTKSFRCSHKKKRNSYGV
ncbi:hypothetical protein TNCV_5017071 [Trichonephila clavipes]|nr:hypothetical protein TNCV_5017071 [Trichonephila clavipes]